MVEKSAARLPKTLVLTRDAAVLVLSPTRELATQIAKEANIILQYHRGYQCAAPYSLQRPAWFYPIS